MSTQVFNQSKLLDIINKAKQETEGKSNNGFAPRTNLFWQTNGTHKVRIFHDPAGELFAHFLFHKLGKDKTVCPNVLKRKDKVKYATLPDCEICALNESIDNHWKAGLGIKSNYVFYIKIYESSDGSDFWKVGEFGAAIMKKKFKDSVINFLSALAKENADSVVGLLNPKAKTYPLSISISGGQQGSVNVSASPFSTLDPIELDDTYVKLTDIKYFPQEYDEEAYNKVVESAREIAKNWVQVDDDGAPIPTDDKEVDNVKEVIESKTEAEALVEVSPTITPEPAATTSSADGSIVKVVSGQNVVIPAEKIQCFASYIGEVKCFTCNIASSCMMAKMT